MLTHSVIVMVAQADGASCVLRSDPELAERALRAIGDTGREALAELRNLLGVLRDGRTPGVHGLSGLVERVRGPGLAVSLELTGDLAVPTGVGLSVYRIVQEALTNVVKHAGASTAAVQVRRDGMRVEVEVTDDGNRQTGNSGGSGLSGMRERVAACGGTLDTGPRPGGGWRVHAVLPTQV